jgi:hypothetical protein
LHYLKSDIYKTLIIMYQSFDNYTQWRIIDVMRKVKCLYLITLIVGLLSSCTYTASNMTHGGFYIAGIDFVYCTSEKTCLHETAHQIDARHGFISSSIEYQIAIRDYAVSNPGKLWSREILSYSGQWSEMYAQMYESVHGRVELFPVELQKYY